MASLTDILLKVFGLLGLIGVSGAGIAGAAYLLFRTLGAKWLDAKFNERLEDYRHAQQQELEKLRAQINAAMDRQLKVHQREFDTVPELWSLLAAAMGAAIDFTARLQQLPDLNTKNHHELEDFLDQSPIAAWQKDEVRKSRDKTRQYDEYYFGHRAKSVFDAYSKFHNYLVQNGIFVPPELKLRFAHIGGMIFAAIDERREEHFNPNPRPGRYENGDRLWKDGQPAFRELEREVQARLWGPSKQPLSAAP